MSVPEQDWQRAIALLRCGRRGRAGLPRRARRRRARQHARARGGPARRGTRVRRLVGERAVRGAGHLRLPAGAGPARPADRGARPRPSCSSPSTAAARDRLGMLADRVDGRRPGAGRRPPHQQHRLRQRAPGRPRRGGHRGARRRAARPARAAARPQEVAAPLYTGLVTDTGSFTYAATSPQVHELAARLLATGIRHDLISRAIWDTQPFGYVQLLGEVCARARLEPDAAGGLGLVWTEVGADDLRPARSRPVRRRGRHRRPAHRAWRPRSRSSSSATRPTGCGRCRRARKGAVDVGAVCTALGGGGHRFAAGFTSDGRPPGTIGDASARPWPAPRTCPVSGGTPAPDGLLVVDKPAGWTSHDVVARCRRLARTRKVGHAGTLDPMATGVLVLGVGRATRLLGHLTLTDKAYDATVRLGATHRHRRRRGRGRRGPRRLRRHRRGARGRARRADRRDRAGAVGGVRGQGRRGPLVRPGARRRGRRAGRAPGRGRRGWTCWPAAGTTSTSSSRSPPARTSARSPATSARRSASAATSPRCAAPGSARSASTRARPLDALELRRRRRRRGRAARRRRGGRLPRRALDGGGGRRAVARPPAGRRAASRASSARSPPTAGASRWWRTATAPPGRSWSSPRPDQPGHVAGWQRAALARDERDALGVGAVRRHHRRLRRRAPRPPADHRPGGRPGPRARRPERRADLRPAPQRGGAARQPPADAHQPGATRPTCSRRSASTWCACCRSPGVQPARPRTRSCTRCSSSTCTREAVVVGENFRYGAKAAGDVARWPRPAGGSASPSRASPLLGSDDTTWSSTYVRSCVQAGDVEGAAARARPRAPRRGRRRARRPARPRARLPDRQPAAAAVERGAGRRRLRRAGWCAAASTCRRPSASAPTRPSPGSSGASRRTSWTSPATSTASTSGCRSPPGCATPALRRRRAAVAQMATTSSAPARSPAG